MNIKVGQIESSVRKNKQGQSLGRKGLNTRKRLLNAAEALLEKHSPVDLTAVSIAKAANMSSATFYMYFDDIQDILAALSEVAGQEMDRALDVLGESWSIDTLEEHASKLVDAFHEVWKNHRQVLRYRNMEADRGDPVFEEIRMNVYVSFVELLAQRIIALCPEEIKLGRADARSVASVLHGAMERMAATDPEIVERNLGIERSKAAQVRVITDVILASSRNARPLFS